jgi:TrmH family RNA methyltransferase
MAARLVARFRGARRDPSLVVLEGFHALKHALRFGADIRTAASPDPPAVTALALELAPDLAVRLDAMMERCGRDLFDQLTPTPPETGVVAIAARPDVASARLRADRPLVVLDAPRHLGNLGAAVRVAAAADAAGVVVVGDVDPWHPTAVRGAAGLQFALPCRRVQAVTEIARSSIGFDAAGVPAADIDAAGAFVFGSERHGLTAPTRAALDRLVALPMRAGVSSLNLATAVAAALYSLAPPITPRRDA